MEKSCILTHFVEERKSFELNMSMIMTEFSFWINYSFS